MHAPRPPALGQGTVACLWATSLSLLVFVGMLAISISKATSIVVSIVAFAVIFFVILLRGGDAPGRRQKSPTEGRGR